MRTVFSLVLVALLSFGAPLTSVTGAAWSQAAQASPQIGLTDILGALFRSDPATEVDVPDPLADMIASTGADVDLASVLAAALAVNEDGEGNTVLSYSHFCEESSEDDDTFECSLSIITSAEDEGETYESAIILTFNVAMDEGSMARLVGAVGVALAG